MKVAGVNNQAETIYFNSAVLAGSRMQATFMNFFSAQDTIQTKGWAWYYKSLIKGDVDFIWGSPFAALFEESELRTAVDPSSPTSGGYVIESRTAFGYPGFVVLNSALTRESGVPAGATMLGRQASNVSNTATYCNAQFTAASGSPGNANLYCNNVAYINTRMGAHIAAAGWLYSYAPPVTTPTRSAGYRESGSMDASGAALDLSARSLTYASTSQDLSGLASRAKVFAQWGTTDGTSATTGGWAPATPVCGSAACTTSK